MTCGSIRPLLDGGVYRCTRPVGHRTNHIDLVANVGWSSWASPLIKVDPLPTTPTPPPARLIYPTTVAPKGDCHACGCHAPAVVVAGPEHRSWCAEHAS